MLTTAPAATLDSLQRNAGLPRRFFRVNSPPTLADSVWLGLTLAALVLTKVVFVYLWIFIALMFVALDAIDRRIGRSTAMLLAVFLASHFVPVGAWMARDF